MSPADMCRDGVSLILYTIHFGSADWCWAAGHGGLIRICKSSSGRRGKLRASSDPTCARPPSVPVSGSIGNCKAGSFDGSWYPVITWTLWGLPRFLQSSFPSRIPMSTLTFQISNVLFFLAGMVLLYLPTHWNVEHKAHICTGTGNPQWATGKGYWRMVISYGAS
ncbi:hypothetical protein EDB19DRAFT_1830103 [Suillus lakei]|nr:hypothetical protein EDB19DRAFT_1830103 [Suillus lakei]